MAKDDFFRIVYVILSELYGHLKDGTKANLEDIGPKRFNISDGYLLVIIDWLSTNGYVSGVRIRKTKTGRAVGDMEDIMITPDGIKYLQENSTMKKVYRVLKEVRDWAPGF